MVGAAGALGAIAAMAGALISSQVAGLADGEAGTLGAFMAEAWALLISRLPFLYLAAGALGAKLFGPQQELKLTRCSWPWCRVPDGPGCLIPEEDVVKPLYLTVPPTFGLWSGEHRE